MKVIPELTMRRWLVLIITLAIIIYTFIKGQFFDKAIFVILGIVIGLLWHRFKE